MSVVNNILACAKPILPSYMWMYKFKELSKPFELLRINFSEKYSDIKTTINVNISENGISHGIIFWVDCPHRLSYSTKPNPAGKSPNWHKNSIFIFHEFHNCNSTNSAISVSGNLDSVRNAIDIQAEFINIL